MIANGVFFSLMSIPFSNLGSMSTVHILFRRFVFAAELLSVVCAERQLGAATGCSPSDEKSALSDACSWVINLLLESS